MDNKSFGNLIWLLIAAVIVLAYVVTYCKLASDCDARHGTLVQGTWGYACVREAP